MQSAQGYVQLGGQVVVTNGVSSTTKTLRSYPGCTVSVFNAGTATLSTIYSDNIGTPLANPFTADATTGKWQFFAANGNYDIQFSGAGITSPFTLFAVSLFDGTALNADNLTSGTVPAARLPMPNPSTLGGVLSHAAVANYFLTGISTTGNPSAARPAAADVTGLAASATVDTTNAANINAGTLAAARLPNPTTSTLGGVQAINQISGKWVDSISTAGVPHLSSPSAGDISGLAASATTNALNAANINAGTLPAGRLPAFSGDLLSAAGSAAPSVVKIGGRTISLNTPAANDILIWSGSAYVPGTPSVAPSGSAGGDLSGTYPNPTVNKLKGIAISGSPVADRCLILTSPTTGVWTELPDAPDAGGIHLNYDTATHTFSAGTSGNPGNSPGAVAVADLPSASLFFGATRVVNDAATPVAQDIVVGGGGDPALVWSDGTHWTVIGITGT